MRIATMRPSTDSEKTSSAALKRMVEYLTRSHLDCHGGYPYGYRVTERAVYVAELDDAKERNRTLLASYPIKTLLEWHDDALEYLSGQPGSDWQEALMETRQDHRMPDDEVNE